MKKICCTVLAAACISGCLGLGAFAAGWKEDETSHRIWYSTNDTDTDWYHDGWQEIDGAWYYFWDDGFVASGLVEDGGSKYYFDSDGRQLFGWQMIDGSFSYFNKVKGTEGYMLSSAEVKGITIDENGRAVETNDSLELLAILYRANKMMEGMTTASMSDEEKLQACFNGLKSTSRFPYWSGAAFDKNEANWVRRYANDIFVKSGGNCFSLAAAFAYLADAIGYPEVYVATDTGHGWTEINGCVYDVDWARGHHNDTYFAMPYALSGVDGRPNYARNLTLKVQV